MRLIDPAADHVRGVSEVTSRGLTRSRRSPSVQATGRRAVRIAGALVLVCTACGSPTAPKPKSAILTLRFEDSRPSGEWETMRILVDNAATVDRAREYLRDPSPPVFPGGKIIRGQGVDPRFPFHYVPETVQLIEGAVEVCDGRPMHTPHEVNVFVGGVTGDTLSTEATWCPGNARVSAVAYIAG